MRFLMIISFLTVLVAMNISFTDHDYGMASLRKLYEQEPAKWPKPNVSASINWKELGSLPAAPIIKTQFQNSQVLLGKILFFDPRLSGSGKISCATCHQPEMNWTDALTKSFGHDSALNKRNSPTIQNVWFYSHLFWDGRSASLEDQAFGPINNESEMHGDMPQLSRKLRKIAGYLPLFKAAYGDENIDPDRITEALAAFQRSITSAPSRFDEFLSGQKNRLNNREIRGLHIFRTKAGCMNCHNGPLFTDNQFHNNGFAAQDVGHYFVSHKEEDMGKFKTPSLRDVMKTGPWMHDGSQNSIEEIINIYNSGIHQDKDSLIQKLKLSRREKQDLLAFLVSISADPLPFNKPLLPE